MRRYIVPTRLASRARSPVVSLSSPAPGTAPWSSVSIWGGRRERRAGCEPGGGWLHRAFDRARRRIRIPAGLLQRMGFAGTDARSRPDLSDSAHLDEGLFLSHYAATRHRSNASPA